MIAGTLTVEMNANIARLSKDMAEAKSVVGGAMRNIDNAVARTKGLLASLGVGVGFQQIIALTDQYTKFTAQLKLATTSQAEYGKALSDVRSIAQAAQTDLGGVGVLYARIANGTRELGISQQRVANITEVVSLALKASGASTGEAASAMLQLSQAFGSGVLRGQEFNAVNEAAPRLMKALADGIGVPVGQLRAMAEAGKLTSEVMANALPRALEELRKEAAQVQTIGGAFTVLKNNVMEFIGTQAQANGSVKAITSAISLLADNLNTLAAVVTGLTVLKLSQWVIGIATALHAKTTALVASVSAIHAERAATIAATTAEIARAEATLAFITADRARAVSQLQSAQATIASTAAMGAQSAALAANTAATANAAAAIASLANLGRLQATSTAALATAQTAHNAALASGGIAATGLSRVLGLLGGPIGAITTLLGLGATAWMLWGNRSDEAAKKAASAIESTTPEILANLDKQNAKLRERIALASAGQPGIASSGGEPAERLASLLRQINDLRAKGANLSNVERIDLIELQGRYNDLAKALGVNKGLLGEIAAIGQRKGAEKWMEEYATQAEKLAKELKKARDELGPEFTPEIERRIREKFKPKAEGGPENPYRQLMADLQKKIELDKESTEVERLAITMANMRADAIKKLTAEERQNLVAAAQAADAKRAEKDALAAYTKEQEQMNESRKEFAEYQAAEEKSSLAAAQRYRELIDPLEALRIKYEEIDRLVAGRFLTDAEGRLAKLPDEVRALLQPVKNLHDQIQTAWEAGLLTTEQMQGAVLRASDKIDKATDSAKDFGHAISTAFEDAVIEGRKFSDVVKALGVTIAKIFFRQQVTKPLENAMSGFNFGGLLQGLLNLGGTPIIQPMVPNQYSLTNPQYGHTGGIVGQLHTRHAVNADVFNGAPRFHRGGIAAGEVPVVAKVGEGIFTPEQMAALSPANDQPTIVIDQSGWTFGSDVNQSTLRTWGKQIKAETLGAMADQTRRGGSFRKAVRG